MVSPEDVFDFMERLYASEVEVARFYSDCARKHVDGEHWLQNAKMQWMNAKNLRARINMMRGNL